MYNTEKLREFFPATTVYKDSAVMANFRSAAIPAFLRDWIVRRKAGPDGRIADPAQLSDYVAAVIPRREERQQLEDEARSCGQTRKFLANVSVQFNSKANYYTFELADLGFTHGRTIIEDYVWDRVKQELLGASGSWGLMRLGYMPPSDGKKNGKFTLLDYQSFCPYRVDLDLFRQARAHFTAEEWIDILLGAIDYNPDGYDGADDDDGPYEAWEAKHTMLTRLLPFVEPRLNLVELAPKGTGKSYVFGKVCKYGWIVGGSGITRASLFYNKAKGQAGLIEVKDFIAMDEIQSVDFGSQRLEMQDAFKQYMEGGVIHFGPATVKGDAGIILLGNIDRGDMDIGTDKFRTLPPAFHESALLDRFHGFIQGSKIPRLTEKMTKLNTWALNTEYFTEIMHLLRSPSETLRYRAVVEELVQYPEDADKRDTDAVLRLCTAYLKLFFPHITGADACDDPRFRREFNQYCLRPARAMRGIIRKQLRIIDPAEFGSRDIATYRLRGIS